MAIIVSDMCKSFHGVTALDSTSFMVADGELFSLLGPENSGKSTIISCLSTLSTPDSGLAEINGRTLGVADESIAADIGVLFESIFLDLKLTVRGNIAFYAALHGISDEGLNNLAARLDITAILNRRLGTLSIGEQRRVDLARALIHNPAVLLLDEPVRGLDPHSASVIWKVIGEELEQGTTILLATEDAGTAIQADRVGILIAGRVLAMGTPGALISDYCPSVLLLRLADPDASARELASVGIFMPDPDPDGQVELQLDPTSARDVISLLGDQVLTFEFRNGTLDEVVRVLSREDAEFSTDDAHVLPYDSEPADEEVPDDAEEDDIPGDDSEMDDFAEDDEVIAFTEDDDEVTDFTEDDSDADYLSGDDPDAGYSLEDTGQMEGGVWDDRVIAPVWSSGAQEEPEYYEDYGTEPWDDEIYIRSDVHDPDSALILPRREYSEAPETGADETDVQWDEEWEDEPGRAVPEHWLKAQGFADTGRRGDYHPAEPYDVEDDDTAYEEDADDSAYGEEYEDGSAEADDYASDDDQPIDVHDDQDHLSELNEIIWEEQRRVDQADQLDRLAIVTRLLEDAVLTDPLPPFDETFPIDHLPYVARDFSAPKPRSTTWYEEMRRPINEEMAKQARIQLAVEKRIEEARRRLDEQGGLT